MLFTQAKRCLSQAASSIKYDTEICIFVNLFQLLPIDVKFVISSSIFTNNNEFRFININFQTPFYSIFV